MMKTMILLSSFCVLFVSSMMVGANAASSSSSSSRSLVNVPALRDILPFDVVVLLKSSNTKFKPNDQKTKAELTPLVTQWLNDGFQSNVETLELENSISYSSYNTALLDQKDSVESDTNMNTFVMSYKGVSVWNEEQDKPVPDETLVGQMQLDILSNNDEDLLKILQNSTLDSIGLGSAVLDVDARLPENIKNSAPTPMPAPNNNNGNQYNNNGGGGEINIIIIVAIVIAVLAFALLSVALFLAYKRRRESDDVFKRSAPNASANNKSNGGGNTPRPKKSGHAGMIAVGSGSMDEDDNKKSSSNKKKNNSRTTETTDADDTNRASLSVSQSSKDSKSKRGFLGFGSKRNSNSSNNNSNKSKNNQQKSSNNNFVTNSDQISDIGDNNTFGENDLDNNTLTNGGLYPESLISEDINSSLTAYYASGMHKKDSNSKKNSKKGGAKSTASSGIFSKTYDYNMNDAASISSMESYGYSLDGYQSSIAGGGGGGYGGGGREYDNDINTIDTFDKIAGRDNRDAKTAFSFSDIAQRNTKESNIMNAMSIESHDYNEFLPSNSKSSDAGNNNDDNRIDI